MTTLNNSGNDHGRFSDGTRHELLKRLAALGLTAPAALAAFRISGAGAEHTVLAAGDFEQGFERIPGSRQADGRASFTTFDLKPTDLPWKTIDIEAQAGQEITILLGAREWLAKAADVWVEPGLAFFFRIGAANPIFNPQKNTATFTAQRQGQSSIARAIGEWQDKNATAVATPEEIYTKAGGSLQGIALVWCGKAVDGLTAMSAIGLAGTNFPALAGESDLRAAACRW